MPALCVIPGDGIGQEVIPAAVKIMMAAIPNLRPVYADAGWNCFLRTGKSVPAATLEKIRTRISELDSISVNSSSPNFGEGKGGGA